MSWQTMSFGRKIAVGFGTVLLLLGVVNVMSVTGVGEIVHDAEEVIQGNKLDGTLAQMEVDHLNWAGAVNALLTDEGVTTLQVQTDDHQCAFGQWLYGEGRQQAEHLVPSLAPLLKAIEEPHHRLHASAVEIGRHFRQADLALGNFLREKKADHLAWAHRVKDVFVDHSLTAIEAESDPHKCSLGQWMTAPETEALKKADPAFAALLSDLEEPHTKLHTSVLEIQKMLAAGDREGARAFYMQNTKPLTYVCLEKIDAVLAWHDAKVQGMQAANTVYAEQTAPALQATQELLGDIRAEAKNHIMTDAVMLEAAKTSKRNVTGVGAAAVIIGILFALFISRGIIRVLKRISSDMDTGAEQVASASGQVSSSSQQLAEGASEQAASIEETSSSLEEMSSMTKQNAANAAQADGLMKESNGIVQRANASMEELTGSMTEISKASEETSKIIKTIDEIAFQTNLLALNAAVEAARAGEAGAGFAVVADEVRNLAMRAAEAAKDTSGLIEDTVKKVGGGSELVSRTNEAFSQVADSSRKVSELVGEIAAASREQAQGIEQVNTAVTEMDKVVQQNAASAEESASAAEEMNAQAEQMKAAVNELMLLVGGRGAASGGAGHPAQRSTPATAPRKRPATVKKRVASSESPQAEQLIPLEDDDLAGF